MNVVDGRRALLERLIDDAGLFPPASLPMGDALAAHATNRAGPHAWMLGRFLCPASRLEELAAELPETITDIRLGVILDRGLERDMEVVGTVAASDSRLTIDTIEVRLPDTGSATVAAVLDAVDDSGLGSPVTPYLESPSSTNPETLMATVEAVASVRAAHAGDRPVTAPPGAKIRFGGARAEQIPPADAVARFIGDAVRQGVPFKATAGLHHAVRRTAPTMHGFLNLLGATTLAVAGRTDPARITDVIEETDPAAFRVDEGGFGWRRVGAGPQVVHEARLVAFHAFGSCSFDEPVGDLIALGILR